MIPPSHKGDYPTTGRKKEYHKRFPIPIVRKGGRSRDAPHYPKIKVQKGAIPPQVSNTGQLLQPFASCSNSPGNPAQGGGNHKPDKSSQLFIHILFPQF